MAGVLKLLGLRIPQPEVPATRSNPKGHFEPQWVVDFQQRLLGRVHVKLTDARPQAFDDTARVGLRTDTQETLREWLAPQLTDPADVVVEDPRSTWFVPMWKQVADDLGANLATLTMLRHPAEVVGSKNAYYYRKESPERRRVGETSRVASWVNVALFGELATRGRPGASCATPTSSSTGARRSSGSPRSSTSGSMTACPTRASPRLTSSSTPTSTGSG